VERATAEELPFGAGEFDASLAQLVVHFMADPVAGLREMARVTRAGGTVAACVWDHAEGGRGPLSPFHRPVDRLDPSQANESERPGVREGHLTELFAEAGIGDLRETVLTASVEHPSFDDYWAPFELRVGPTSALLSSLSPARLELLREYVREE